ncbi:agmatine deiminase family protein [Flavobacterium collinsii]|uniref:Agmatine deiminase n=1 Tax=Flavobacterium collinsii TaxID=1114861 RepID=A0A9W4X7S6_9FLAO|nr:agmatine deiminase family protein [Flavobacterium collinsii]CAI2768669.1 Agmatine deiminase [Flavobacterium collinsii]
MRNIIFLIILFPMVTFCQKEKKDSELPSGILYTMPEESEAHEATWLQWPHEFQYGETYAERLDDTWIAMTAALISSEKVNIIAYDEEEKEKIQEMLVEAEVSLKNIRFFIYPTDDVWVRDNGPIFVRNKSGKIVIQDWGFNGWGKKAAYKNCNIIPSKIAKDLNIESIDLNAIIINEGGSVEIDGNGTMLACKSSILNKNRNPGMTQIKAEAIFKKYLGVSNFIWLEGKAGLEITDMHIDGFARFANSSTIVTMSENDLIDWQVPEEDISELFQAKNRLGKPYKIVELPLTKEDVTTEYGKNLEYKGSYVNYYIANKVILVPNYNDQNDKIANAIIQKLYPTRAVVGIDVRNLYANGGMIHCVTQQQPK